MITVTATLQQKKNIYYAVLYYKDEFNNIQRKCISTKLRVMDCQREYRKSCVNKSFRDKIKNIKEGFFYGKKSRKRKK